MRTPRAVSAVVVAVLVSLAVGCGGKMGSPDPPANAQVEAVYEIRGTVVAVDAGRRLLEINHEAIPGFMPAMTMSFRVGATNELAGLKAGDAIGFSLVVTANES